MVDFWFITVLTGIVGMLLGVIGMIIESQIIFSVGYIIVISALIGLVYMWMLRS